MLFLARMDVNFPASMSAETRQEYMSREREYSGSLQSSGKMKGIWRIVGEYSNFSIFDVSDHDEMHSILSSFPMFDHMQIKVTALARHPNATREDFFA